MPPEEILGRFSFHVPQKLDNCFSSCYSILAAIQDTGYHADIGKPLLE